MYLNPKEHEVHKGFYYCWFANETIVNKHGDAISLRTGKKLPKWFDSKEDMMRGVIHHNGEKIYTNIGLLVAKNFLSVPEKLLNKRIFAHHKDKNRINDSINNLEWITAKERQLDTFLRRRNNNKQIFYLPDYVDNVDFYNIDPIPCKFKPGYFYIPFTKAPIVINKVGHLFNLDTNKEHPVTIDPKGYLVTQLGADCFMTKWSVHRIVALVFIKKPDRHIDLPFQELEVNHKDAIKTNNDYQNLEWVTGYENTIHAWNNNLVKTNKIVLSRNIVTNEITEYFSITQCANIFNVDNAVLSIHLNSMCAGRIIKNNHVFKFKTDSTDWPIELAIDTGFYNFRPHCNFVFINKITHDVKVFCSLPEACEYLDININVLKNNKRRYGTQKPTNEWIYISLEEYLENPLEKYTCF